MPHFSFRGFRPLLLLACLIFSVASLSAAPLDAEDTATSLDLGSFVGLADNAPVRSIFDLLSVGTLISSAQAESDSGDSRLIARDTPVRVGSREETPDFNLTSAAYTQRLPRNFALRARVENNKFGQQSYLYSPQYETYGVDNSRPDRTDGSLTLIWGKQVRLFGGLNYNLLTSPISRSEIGLAGIREGRGRIRQDLTGLEGGIGFYREFLGGLFQGYAKGTVGSGQGALRFRLLTLGHSMDPRTEEERLNDSRNFLETDYLEIVAGKIRVQSLYGIAETGVLYRPRGRYLGRVAFRLGLFFQAYTYQIPGIEGNLYFRATSGDEVFTPLQLVPSGVVQNVDTIRGLTFSFLIKI